MRTHVIVGGVVVDTIMASVTEAQVAYPDAVCVDGEIGAIGWGFVDAELVPPPARAVRQADYTDAMTALFDTTAQSRNYDNRITCALRAGLVGSPFQAEGIAFGLWMDGCNALGYTIMAEVMQGQRAQPTVSEFMALLPAMEWPAS